MDTFKIIEDVQDNRAGIIILVSTLYGYFPFQVAVLQLQGKT